MKPDEKRLRHLLTRGLDGDQASYREFLSEISSLVRNYVQRQLRRLGHGDSDGHDIAQEALIAIHARRHTYDRDVPVTAWVHAIARYKLIDSLRAVRRTRDHLSLDDIEAFVGDDAARFETSLTVRKLLGALPQRLSAPTALMKLEGLSAAETAARTGQSESAVKVNVHRAMKAMARMFR